MKRNVILIIILFVFNLCWLYGISYANRLLLGKNLIIDLDGKEKSEKGNEVAVIVEYEGESYQKVGEKIEKFLIDTKLAGKGEYIAKYAISKQVNPYLIGGMIIVNSNCEVECNAIVKHCNNVGDLRGSNGGCFGGNYRKYNSIEDSIKDLVDYVLNNYYSKDMKSPASFYTSYKKNSAWAYNVSRYMEKLKK